MKKTRLLQQRKIWAGAVSVTLLPMSQVVLMHPKIHNHVQLAMFKPPVIV